VHRRGNLHMLLSFALFLALAATLLAQDTPDNTEKREKTFVVNGRTVDGAVIQVNGHSYVDVESLAEITNGVVTIEPNRIVLNIPGPDASNPASPTAPPTSQAQGLSENFVRAAIAELGEMREWRGAIGAMITYGLAVSGTWSQDYHDRVETGLTAATTAASTDSDRNALILLNNQFDKLAGWANDVLTARQALDAERTVNPNTLRDDPALAKITDCGQFLDAMLVSGSFADSPSCH